MTDNKNNPEEKFTTVRITIDFHNWIFDQGKKGETYSDVLERLSGYKPKDSPESTVVIPSG